MAQKMAPRYEYWLSIPQTLRLVSSISNHHRWFSFPGVFPVRSSFEFFIDIHCNHSESHFQLNTTPFFQWFRDVRNHSNYWHQSIVIKSRPDFQMLNCQFFQIANIKSIEFNWFVCSTGRKSIKIGSSIALLYFPMTNSRKQIRS